MNDVCQDLKIFKKKKNKEKKKIVGLRDENTLLNLGRWG
jgi:hypothetical protein